MKDNSLFGMVLIIGGVCLILMVIFYAAGTIMEQSTTDNTETFATSTQFEDKICTLSYTPSSLTSVRYYNGASWTTLTSSDYTLSGNILTVDADAMD